MVRVEDSSNIPGLILHEIRGLLATQHERLKSLRTLLRGILAGFLSAGAIAVGATDEFGTATAIAVIGFAVWLFVLAMAVEYNAQRWDYGLDIDRLPFRARSPVPASSRSRSPTVGSGDNFQIECA